MIRRATPEDEGVVGEIFVRARDEMTYLPRIPDEDRGRLGGWIVGRHEVWVGERDGQIVGFLGLSPGWVDHLYVEPSAQNAGIGTSLLEHAKGLHPTGLQLWAFQRNEGAHRFYLRHGFRVVETTGGAGNMEREPDARYVWEP